MLNDVSNNYVFRNTFSNSSKDFPLVSGSILINITKPISAMIPNIKNVKPLPKLDNSQGNINCTIELINEFTKAMTPIAKPLYFIG